MGYWFEDPTLKALAPLALSSSIRGLTTIFNTPKIYAGFNVLPEGPVIGPTTLDALDSRCPQKRAFIVSDKFNQPSAKKAGRFLESGGFATEIWAKDKVAPYEAPKIIEIIEEMPLTAVGKIDKKVLRVK